MELKETISVAMFDKLGSFVLTEPLLIELVAGGVGVGPANIDCQGTENGFCVQVNNACYGSDAGCELQVICFTPPDGYCVPRDRP